MADESKKIRRKRSEKPKQNHDFFLVGLGASAGGIKALEDFFENMDPASGMAFVVILHLSPEHVSNLAAMLQRKTLMPVAQVNESVKVEPDHVYVIPPAKHLQMVDGLLQVTDPENGRGRHVPIDHFFRTLGGAYREHAIGVVLSGTGTDGTLGLRRIKEEGGISLAQDPREAEYEGMPRNAIDEGLADFILSAAEMPEKLVAIRDASLRIQLPPEGDKPPKGPEAAALRDVLTLLRVRTGQDFTNYKQSTVLRRVTRRMQMSECPDLASYLRYLREHPPEVLDLQQDMLISVTNFFRDHEAFDYLAEKIVPQLFEGKADLEQVRVWVTGCATGEEAYSIAILLAEHAERLERPPGIQVFATDLDGEAITQARDGLFPDTIAADVTPERLKRFFVSEGQHYRVKKQVREMVLFAPHNILRDPPFSRLDMVSCRNLLIYLNRDTQDRVLEIFHFSLRPGGFLFLGSSESADNLPDLFTPVDKKLRVFRRNLISSSLQHIPAMPLKGNWEARMPSVPVPARKALSYSELHQKLVEQFAPPSVLVNESYDVMHVSENAGRYLRFSGGEPTRSLMMLIHPDLRIDLRAALYTATQEAREAATRRVSLEVEGEARQVRIIVRPVRFSDLYPPFLLVIFDEMNAAAARPDAQPEVEDEDASAHEDGLSNIVSRLEDELQQTRGILRSTVEQYETSTEELKASNEELQAMNEELRSATEELETSKEELQSLNEELHTVNIEMKDKVEQVSQANADLTNLLASTDIGTVFLNRDLKITRFTPRLEENFNVLPTDIGRPLMHLTHKFDYGDMERDARRVLQTLERVEREVRSVDGRWYLARMLPYRTAEDKIIGLVLTFVDITDRKRIEEERTKLSSQMIKDQAMLQAVVKHMPAGVIVAEYPSGNVLITNEQARRIWKMPVPAPETIEQFSNYVGLHKDGRPYTWDEWPLARVFKTGEQVDDEEVEVERGDGARAVITISASPIRDADGKVAAGVMIFHDITLQQGERALLRGAEESLRLIIESVTDHAIITMDSEGIITQWNQGAENIFGFSRAEAIGQHTNILFTPEDRAAGAAEEEMRSALAHGAAEDERWHVRKDGSRFYASGILSRIRDGSESGFVKVARDLTERQLQEEERSRLTGQIEAEREQLEGRVRDRTRDLETEIIERRNAEGQVKELLRRVVSTQELERRRISRDLHDMLGQQLTALRLNLETIKKRCGDQPELGEQVEQAQSVARQLDAEVDFLAWELRPATLDEFGLVTTLDNFTQEWTKHYGIEAEFHTTGLTNARLAPEAEVNLYRIAQEALNNVYKHAAATRADVILERRDRFVVLVIEDNGRGFDPGEDMSFNKGLGLISMRERAALVGGSLEIESTGEGTTVFVRVPLRPVQG